MCSVRPVWIWYFTRHYFKPPTGGDALTARTFHARQDPTVCRKISHLSTAVLFITVLFFSRYPYRVPSRLFPFVCDSLPPFARHTAGGVRRKYASRPRSIGTNNAYRPKNTSMINSRQYRHGASECVKQINLKNIFSINLFRKCSNKKKSKKLIR